MVVLIVIIILKFLAGFIAYIFGGWNLVVHED